jgi:ParB-like chromosome segregation protein Spo0J
MLELRPIVVDENNIVLGGNMRLKACKEAGLKEVYIVKAENLTEQQKDEFIVKDNVGFGEWDWDILANEWDVDLLDEWGLDVPVIKEYEEVEPSGYDLTQKWFLNVEFENEQDCEKWYNSLIEEGLICKIVQ